MSTEGLTAASLGRPMRGPSALGGDRRRFLHLTKTLAVSEFKLRFFDSVLGYFWQLVRPLLLFAVLYVVFTQFVRISGGVPFYPVMLLTGVVLFTFFAEATGGAVGSVLDRENLVRKIQFPRMVIPLSVVLTAYFNLLLNLIAVAIFAVSSGVEPRLSWLQFPLLLLVLGIWCVGLSMLLAALFVRFRDVKPIWEVIVQALFYAAPVIYPIEKIPNPKWGEIVMCNPLATILEQTRHAVVDPGAPSALEAIGPDGRILIPIVLMLLSVGVGFWLFNREAPRIAEQL